MLNLKKTKYSIFHKPRSKDSLPLKLPDISINDLKIERERNFKFLGVTINENLKWKSKQ